MSEHVLDIDVGNTRLKWRYSSAGKIIAEGAIAHAHCRLDELPVPTDLLDRVRIASVVQGELLHGLLEVCRKQWQIEPEIAEVVQYCAGVTQGYSDPSRLGVDRWLALLAAYSSTRGACVVVSCGTAVTVDLVTDRGVHLGGYIVPGLELMRAALFSGTSAVQLEKIDQPGSLAPGKDTASAVSRGLVLMVKGLVESAELDLRNQGRAPKIIITGGDSELILPFLIEPILSTKAVSRPNLVLDGLVLALP